MKAEGHMPRRGKLAGALHFPSCRTHARAISSCTLWCCCRATIRALQGFVLVTNRAACRAGEGKVQEFSLHAQARRPMRGAAHRAQTKRREKCRSQGVPQCGTQACVQERRTSETSTLRFFTFQPSSCTPLFPLQELPDYLEGQWENFFNGKVSSVVPTVPKVAVPSDVVEGAS